MYSPVNRKISIKNAFCTVSLFYAQQFFLITNLVRIYLRLKFPSLLRMAMWKTVIYAFYSNIISNNCSIHSRNKITWKKKKSLNFYFLFMIQNFCPNDFAIHCTMYILPHTTWLAFRNSINLTISEFFSNIVEYLCITNFAIISLTTIHLAVKTFAYTIFTQPWEKRIWRLLILREFKIQ